MRRCVYPLLSKARVINIMALQLTVFHFTSLLTAVSVINHISAIGIGKIHIGEPRNSTSGSTKIYSWPFYEKTGLLPIYLSVQNSSIASDVFLSPTENVTVYCQQNPNSIGFSLVQFSPLFLAPPITEGYVSVEFLRPGRPVNVQCFGVSENLSLNPQFLNETSLSKPRMLVIKRPPVVNVCNSSIVVPSRNQSRNITGVITARLSESTTSSVTVVCQQEVLSEQEVFCQQEQNVSDWNTMQIMLENLTLPNNSKSFEISYTVKELGSPVQVYCEAYSSEGNQYLLSTSKGYPTRFQQNQVFLNFHPSILKVKSLSFQVYLSYTTLIIEDITNTVIQCDVATVDCSKSIAAVSKCFPDPSMANNTVNVSSEVQKTTSDNFWELDERIFKVNSEPLYKLLQLKRTSIAEVDIKETVEINCFVLSAPNINTTFSAAVSLNPPLEYNLSSISLKLEASSLNNIDPLSKNFVPCSCDLKATTCDINCCCDSDCQDFQELNSNQCPNEDTKNILLTHLCEAHKSLKMSSRRFWLCVIRKDNSFLGIYYNNQQPILNPTSFRETWSEIYSYRETNTPRRSLNERNGNLLNNGHQSATYYLPQRVFSGHCITSAPLPFFVDVTSDCTSSIDNDSCSKNPVLSAMSYVLPTSLIDSDCVSPNNILTDVNYFCAKNVNSYVKTSNTGKNNWKDDFNKSVNENKDFETRCSWDDSYTKPPVPTIRKRQNEAFCDNVVLRVNYQFTWNKTGITFLNASIILGNVSISKINESMKEENVSKTGLNNNNNNDTCLNESITHLTQHFKVLYIKNQQSERKLVNGQTENPGYFPGRPVQNGISVNTTNSSLFIDQSITHQIFVWNPDPSGFCALAGKRQIMFGEDIYSSCFFPLKQVDNCETIRKEVLSLLDQLIPADRIGRFGRNNASIESHWIKILRPNVSEIFPDPSNSSNSFRNTNNSSQTNIFHSILMPVTSLNATTDSKIEVSSCDLMPVGIKLGIMYAHTGYAHGTVINEIIGAKISYFYKNWTFHCNDLKLVSCFMKPNIKAENSRLFTLSVAVNFIHVPPTPPQPTIRNSDFYKIKQCWMNSCWQEIFYPLTIQKTFDEYAYNLVTYLMFLFISFVTITQSWLLLDF